MNNMEVIYYLLCIFIGVAIALGLYALVLHIKYKIWERNEKRDYKKWLENHKNISCKISKDIYL